MREIATKIRRVNRVLKMLTWISNFKKVLINFPCWKA